MRAGGGGSLDPTELTLSQLIGFLKVLSKSYLQDSLSSTDGLLQYLYVAEIIFGFTIITVKISILCFYRTIFATPSFRRTTLILGAICALWFTIVLFVTIFQCHPIAAVWDLTLLARGKAHCIPPGAFIFGYEFSNVVTDICILCLPIYMVRRLQLPLRRKVIVSAIFLLGGLLVANYTPSLNRTPTERYNSVCITCIVRMVYSFNPRTGEPRMLHQSLAPILRFQC